MNSTGSKFFIRSLPSLGFKICVMVYRVAKMILWSDPPPQCAWTSDNFSGRLVQKWSNPDGAWFGHDLVKTDTIWTKPWGTIRLKSCCTSGRSWADWEFAGRLSFPKFRKSRLKSPKMHISRPEDTACSHWSRKVTNLSNWLLTVADVLSFPCLGSCHWR